MLNRLGRKGTLAAAALLCWVLLLVALGIDPVTGWDLTVGEANELMWSLGVILTTFMGANSATHFAAKPEAEEVVSGPDTSD